MVAGEDHDFHFRTCREGPVAFLDVPTMLYQVGGSDRLSRHGHMGAEAARRAAAFLTPLVGAG